MQQVGHAPQHMLPVRGGLAVSLGHVPHRFHHTHLLRMVQALIERRGEAVQVVVGQIELALGRGDADRGPREPTGAGSIEPAPRTPICGWLQRGQACASLSCCGGSGAFQTLSLSTSAPPWTAALGKSPDVAGSLGTGAQGRSNGTSRVSIRMLAAPSHSSVRTRQATMPRPGPTAPPPDAGLELAEVRPVAVHAALVSLVAEDRVPAELACRFAAAQQHPLAPSARELQCLVRIGVSGATLKNLSARPNGP